MKNRPGLFQLGMVLALMSAPAIEAAAVQTYGTSYGESCLVCHQDQGAIADNHHIMTAEDDLDCFLCHDVRWNEASQASTLHFRDEGCFLNCHAQILGRIDGPFIRQIPSDPYDGLDYFSPLQSNVKRKMAEAHHGNYGAPESATICGTCHAMVWDSAISAIVTAPVVGSAGVAGDSANIRLVMDPDQLVYDARPGETIVLSAGRSEGSNLSFGWYLHVYSTSAAALYLGNAPDLTYTVSAWSTPGTTNFLELRLVDGAGRSLKKYIAVNVH